MNILIDEIQKESIFLLDPDTFASQAMRREQSRLLIKRTFGREVPYEESKGLDHFRG